MPELTEESSGEISMRPNLHCRPTVDETGYPTYRRKDKPLGSTETSQAGVRIVGVASALTHKPHEPVLGQRSTSALACWQQLRFRQFDGSGRPSFADPDSKDCFESLFANRVPHSEIHTVWAPIPRGYSGCPLSMGSFTAGKWRGIDTPPISMVAICAG